MNWCCPSEGEIDFPRAVMMMSSEPLVIVTKHSPHTPSPFEIQAKKLGHSVMTLSLLRNDDQHFVVLKIENRPPIVFHRSRSLPMLYRALTQAVRSSCSHVCLLEGSLEESQEIFFFFA